MPGLTLEQLQQMGATPAPPAAGGGLTLEQLQAMGGTDTAPVEQYSVPETIGRNAVNLFGLGPAVSGAFQAITSNRAYSEARDETKRHLEEANAQHPIAGYVGKGVALAGETLLGGAAGKALAVGAKLTGATEALSPVMAKLGASGQAIAKGALGGAAYGAAGSAGEAISEGKDVLPAAATGAATGGILGGALGGVAHKIGGALEDAIGTQNESIVRGASERALPRKQSALADLLEKELPANAKSKVTPSQVIQENRDLLKGFRTADPEVVQATRDATLAKVDELDVGKAAKYAAVDKALGGGAPAHAAIDDLENKLATETEAPWKKVLSDKVDSLKQQWSSISTDEAKRYLQSMRVTGDQTARDALEGLASKLPAGEQWTKMQFLDHLVGGERGASTKAWAEIPPDLRKAVESLPFKFDGNVKIPTRDLRRLLTMSQDEAESALGTLNATKNARLAALNREVLGHTLNKQLDEAVSRASQASRGTAGGSVDRLTGEQEKQFHLLRHGAGEENRRLRAAFPDMGGETRARAISDLAQKTPSRIVNGKREFLLYRGDTANSSDHLFTEMSNWTPNRVVAEKFASMQHAGGKLHSEWIPEAQIKAVPRFWGAKGSDLTEHEVWVKASRSRAAAIQAMADPSMDRFSDAIMGPRPTPPMPQRDIPDATMPPLDDVKAAVQAIRDNNVRQSVLLRLADASGRKIEKLRLGKPTLGGIAGHGIAGALGGYELLSAGKNLLHGNVSGAAMDAAGAVAAKYAPQAIAGARRGTVDAMAALQRGVQEGNPKAIALLRSLQVSRRLGTAGAGAVGAATSGTLGGASQ